MPEQFPNLAPLPDEPDAIGGKAQETTCDYQHATALRGNIERVPQGASPEVRTEIARTGNEYAGNLSATLAMEPSTLGLLHKRNDVRKRRSEPPCSHGYCKTPWYLSVAALTRCRGFSPGEYSRRKRDSQSQRSLKAHTGRPASSPGLTMTMSPHLDCCIDGH